ncbi:MAG: 7,8-didemethyl-8-hydroxy-5-deazariboflavin synthase subunit CofG, partial [Actinobacteria bacterium]|nr:7,8-didemethyl-8-hydroxy-5-deazariboflavin synthase subunit CofG [Actinomycetota bacterium]
MTNPSRTFSARTELLAAPLGDLLHEARQVRDAATGSRITYSPKVFIPLTM